MSPTDPRLRSTRARNTDVAPLSTLLGCPVVRPFVLLALNVLIGSVGFWVGGFAGGCILAALVVADCMAVVAEGRAWAREDAAEDERQRRLEKLVERSLDEDGLDWDTLARVNTEAWGREGRAG